MSHPLRYLIVSILYGIDTFNNEEGLKHFLKSLKNDMGTAVYHGALYSAIDYMSDVEQSDEMKFIFTNELGGPEFLSKDDSNKLSNLILRRVIARVLGTIVMTRRIGTAARMLLKRRMASITENTESEKWGYCPIYPNKDSIFSADNEVGGFNNFEEFLSIDDRLKLEPESYILWHLFVIS